MWQLKQSADLASRHVGKFARMPRELRRRGRLRRPAVRVRVRGWGERVRVRVRVRVRG